MNDTEWKTLNRIHNMLLDSGVSNEAKLTVLMQLTASYLVQLTNGPIGRMQATLDFAQALSNTVEQLSVPEETTKDSGITRS